MTAHVEGRLSAYLDGELPVPERAEVEEHLGACTDCARRLEQLAALDAAARALPVAAPAGYFEAFPERVRARLDRPSRTPWRLPVWSWAVAATLLLVVVTPTLLPRAARAPVPEPLLPAASPQLGQQPAGAAAPPMTLADAKRDALNALGYAEGDDKAPRAPAPAEKPRKLAAPAREADASIQSDLARSPAAAPAVVQAPATQTPPGVFAAEPQGRQTVAGAEPRDELDVADRERGQEAKKEAGPGRGGTRPGALGAASTVLGTARLAEARYARLLAKGMAGSPAEARATREAWRGFVRDHPADPRADEARVRAIEAGIALYRLSNDLRELESVRQEATAYLKRDDALLAERVRALLRDLEP